MSTNICEDGLMESSDKTFEQQVIELTNQERAKNGLSPLKANAELNYTADKYAEEMSGRRVLSHTSPDGSQPWDRAEAVGYEAQMMGENIASGQRTPEEVVKAWMNSSGHRANILKPQYTDIGVGFNDNYWVQDFGNGDTNPISKIPGSTSNSEIASKSTPTPESPSTRTATSNNDFSSKPVFPTTPGSTPVSEPGSQSGSETNLQTGGETPTGNLGNDWLLKGGVGDNTQQMSFGRNTFTVGQGNNSDWMQNLQSNQDKGIAGFSKIFEILPTSQMNDQKAIGGDRNAGTLFAQQKFNADAFIAPTQNTFV
ncbi:hypothetical protein BZZ01_13725 [Nostocales cyanobacterium HT-58-2]|nr:hypothetical protein BZZ01_13725 [Nostocales cyanobacterium HT-58-2]